jgi:cytochrome c peroxidase
MEYFFRYPVNLYNRAPVFEVEEPFMEYQSPVGLQYVESLLMEPDAFNNKKELLDQCEVIHTTAADIPSLLYDLKAEDAAIMEANRLEVIRIITLGITGYDAPLLWTGIEESAAALKAMHDNLEPMMIIHAGPEADSIRRYLEMAVDYLTSHPGFDNFDRLAFLTQSALPLQQHLSRFISQNGLELNTHPALNYRAGHLFNKDAINLAFPSGKPASADTRELVALGKELFSECLLSGNTSRSCASCHNPQKFFTDGLVKSKTLDGKSSVLRNAPSIYYSGLQHAQFYDGRATSLEEQINTVLQNPLEMDANLDTVVQRLNANQHYRSQFRKVWPDANGISIDQVAAALAGYEQTLAPFNSAFDRYIGGDKLAMNDGQKRGFNLFMGKAQCGTCHFAPVFNGLLPPVYEVSELEVLGVPQRDAKGRKQMDSDSGRYRFFPISFNNGAFKTTTVRNAAMTAPYMHNGVFRSLEEVLDFYNKGGGRGLGLKVNMQTLSDKPLGLTKPEIRDIISFLEALTDRPEKLQ